MATKNIYTNLLGYNPYEQQLQQQKLWSGLYSGASSPYEKIGLGLAQIGGTLFGQLTNDEEKNPVKQLDQLTAEASQQFSPESPEYFSYIAANTTNPMIKANASKAAAEAEATRNKTMREDVKFYSENFSTAPDRLQELAARIEANPNDKNALKQYNAIANSYQQGFYEDQRKNREAPTTAADRAIFEDFLSKSGGDVVAASRAFKQYNTDLKQRENTPLTVGNIKPSDVSTLVTNVSTQLKPLETKLRTYNEIRALIQQVASGNTAAVPQLERFMATAAGDKQLSAIEIKQLANSGGFVEKTVGGVQKFVLGTPTTSKLNQTVKLINSLEDQASKEFNTTRDKLEATWSTSSFPKETIDAALGKRYIPVSQRDKFSKKKEEEKPSVFSTKSGTKYTIIN
jgi:hypothetical protein